MILRCRVFLDTPEVHQERHQHANVPSLKIANVQPIILSSLLNSVNYSGVVADVCTKR